LPDGTKIAFSRFYYNNFGGIFVMNADGSDQRAVASCFGEPAWSPDGLKLAVGSDAIYLINVDGSNRTQITQPTDSYSDDYLPAWSPDGSKITFTRGTECFFGGCDHEDLWVVNADGSNPTKLVDSPADASAWSPDGTKIIFGKGQNCYNNGNHCVDLFVMNPDGSGLTNITNTNDTNEYFPSWQPISSSGKRLDLDLDLLEVGGCIAARFQSCFSEFVGKILRCPLAAWLGHAASSQLFGSESRRYFANSFHLYLCNCRLLASREFG